MRSLPLFLTAILAASCTPAPQPATTPVSETTAGAAAKPCPETPAAAAAQKDEIDKDILALASAAQKCSFEHGSFDYECAGYKEWREAGSDLFEGPGGNNTILTMLEDKDVRARTLGAQRGFIVARTFFSDEKRGARLLSVIDKEREERLFYSYGRFAAYINGEKVLGKELRALANHPVTSFRSSFAENVLPTHPTEFSLGLVKVFLDDADDSVRRAAIRSLSSNGRTRPTEGICALLKTQLGRNDKLAADALTAGSMSKCPGMAELVVAEIEKRTADAASAAADGAPDYSDPLSSICWRDSTPEPLKKRAFDVASKVAPKVNDEWKRRSYLYVFRNCDEQRAKAALAPFLKDKDKDVVRVATDETKRVEEELKRKK
jgi:hypothetical protein